MNTVTLHDGREVASDSEEWRCAYQRFKDKFILIPFSSCWHWIGSTKSNGYGDFWLGGRVVTAHSASFRLFKDDVKRMHDYPRQYGGHVTLPIDIAKIFARASEQTQ